MTLLSDHSRLAVPATAAVPANRAAAQVAPGLPALPQEVEFILSALEAGQFTGKSRRDGRRWSYRVSAALRLFSDTPQAPPWTLYTRNVGAKGLGFVTRHRLPLGYGGVMTLPTPQHGKKVTIDCTVLRCREAVTGWFEGSVYFNREQPLFDLGALTEI